jgi:polysaccharide export outer membrane protein
MKRFTFSLAVGALIIILISNGYAAEKAYHIGPGDVIEISVWKDPDLSRTLVVPPDGVIAFPLISAINVTHLTVAELRKIVTQK